MTLPHTLLALAIAVTASGPALAQVGLDFDEEFAKEFGTKPGKDAVPVIPMNPEDPMSPLTVDDGCK